MKTKINIEITVEHETEEELGMELHQIDNFLSKTDENKIVDFKIGCGCDCQ